MERIESQRQHIADGLLPKAPPKPVDIQAARLRLLSDVFLVTTLFVIGALAVFSVRLGRHQWLGVDEAELTSLQGVVVDAGLSILIGVLLFAYVKIRSPAMYAVYGFGAMLCYLCMHMLVHAAPELWGQMFSLKWVYMVLQKTDPNAVLQLQF